jgi:hypothetical protein
VKCCRDVASLPMICWSGHRFILVNVRLILQLTDTLHLSRRGILHKCSWPDQNNHSPNQAQFTATCKSQQSLAADLCHVEQLDGTPCTFVLQGGMLEGFSCRSAVIVPALTFYTFPGPTVIIFTIAVARIILLIAVLCGA